MHRQNAELDYEIATVLSEHACMPLDDEIETLVVTASGVRCHSHLREMAA